MEEMSINQLVAQQLGEITQEETVKDQGAVIDFKMVTFSLAEKDYAIDIMNVKEIAKAGRFTYVPNTLPFVLGVYNLRGDIIPILDLRLFFNIDVPERDENKLENLLILNIEDQTFGVVVDKIDKVVGVQKSTIQPPHPLFGDINIKYIYGVVEANKRLYVLLDIGRIFASKQAAEEAQVKKVNVHAEVKKTGPSIGANAVHNESAAPKPAASGSAPTPSAPPKKDNTQNLKFIAESLANYKKFTVSEINEAWVAHRYDEWEKSGKTQIQNDADAEAFLKPFWSSFTNSWWSKEYADAVYNLLPDNSAKQLVVWNPGCGKGCETYCLACVLAKRYPNSKIRVYAQDIDLLTVSNASLMTVPNDVGNGWLKPYLSAKASGELTFNQEIKDSILFEYHDCKNTNALPMVDIVFARDVLSLLDNGSQTYVINDFLDKMKGNGIVVVGENETMPSSFGFGEKTVGTLTAYNKE